MVDSAVDPVLAQFDQEQVTTWMAENVEMPHVLDPRL